MASMADQMKRKAICGTSVKRSLNVKKRIDRADVVALNNCMKLTIEQNRREYKEQTEAIMKDNSIYG